MSDFERLEAAGTDKVILTRGSDIHPRPIPWLWRFWIAQGKLLILAGSPGQGKTTLAALFASIVSRSGRWPDGSSCNGGNVLFWSGEDDIEMLTAKLMAMGADMSRIYFVSGTIVDGEQQAFDPARDMLRLTLQAKEIGDIRMLIVDPIVSAIVGDSHKNAEVRRGLQPLVDLGAALGAAIVGITHLSKGTAGRDPTERVTGSIAFGAVARIVLLAAKVKGEDGQDKRVLVRSKSNMGPDDGGFEYEIEQVEALPGIETSVAKWGPPVAGSARDLLAEAEEQPPEERRATRDAVESLLRILGKDVVPMREVVQKMKAEGHSEKETRTARERIGVLVKRSGFGKEMASYWKLPPGAVVPTDPEEEAPEVESNSTSPLESDSIAAMPACSPTTPLPAPKKPRKRAATKPAPAQAVDVETF